MSRTMTARMTVTTARMTGKDNNNSKDDDSNDDCDDGEDNNNDGGNGNSSGGQQCNGSDGRARRIECASGGGVRGIRIGRISQRGGIIIIIRYHCVKKHITIKHSVFGTVELPNPHKFY